MNRRQTLRGVVAATLVCGIVAGCSAEAADQPRAEAAGAKDRARWVMPLDPYRVDENLFHAEQVLIERCMQGKGFDYHRPPVDVTATSETVTVGGRNLFDVEIAREWGYSGAPSPHAEILQAAEEASFSWPPEKNEQYSACMDEARQEFPQEGVLVNNTLAGFSLSPWNGAVMDPAVVAAAEKWAECMRPLGFSDLPASPNELDGGTPTPMMAAAYGEVADGRVSERSPEQKAEEIRLATFDAECRESSGYAQALYDAEWERQARVLEENKEAMMTLLEEKTAYEQRAREILDGADAP
ncbi:hypothetical protein ACFVTZ_05995 [Cellulosimicrobium cellulans]|uniref:hypothetical protein n=1 Tax=Cellulosimicrobium cellulans TaxID=1710 RepID=UPI0036F0C1A9